MKRKSPPRPLEVESTLTLVSLTTAEECDRFAGRVEDTIARIERDLNRPKSPDDPPDWRRRARTALRLKRRLLIGIQHLRAAFSRQKKEERRSTAAASTGGRWSSPQSGKPHVCPYCGKRHVDPRSLRQHVAGAHSPTDENLTVEQVLERTCR